MSYICRQLFDVKPIFEYKTFRQRIRHKFRLTLLNENTLEELWSVRISRLDGFYISLVIFILMMLISATLIVYTPLRNWLPGYLKAKERMMMSDNALALDSLSHQLALHEQYLEGVKAIITDKIEADSLIRLDSVATAALKEKLIKTDREKEFVEKYEQEERFNLALTSPTITKDAILFFPPAKGIKKARIDERDHVVGVDIFVNGQSEVMSVLEGTVFLSSYSVDNQYIIAIQHFDNFVSFYKGLSQPLKNEGQRVSSGEVIGLTHEKGECPLYFQLWHEGKTVNPTDYILF